MEQCDAESGSRIEYRENVRSRGCEARGVLILFVEVTSMLIGRSC